MLGALELLVALGRDDLPISPANVDEPILTYCKKPCASAPLREIILFAL